MITLAQKQNELRSTIAIADNSDFQLLIDDSDSIDRVINELNEGLINILIDIKANNVTQGEVGAKISQFMSHIYMKYPDAGIGDSEAYQAVARFFSLNYAPNIYNYIRYKIQWS